jgi:fructan beta-fructosidase
MRKATWIMLLSLLAGLAALLPSGAATADSEGDYPEFPYSATSYNEPFRGQFHFSSRSGWMNDPNGLVYANGEYHFFYQNNPHGLAWDTMHWGHATSPDLVHWTQKPVALEPGVQPGNLWSGAGVADKDNTSGLRTGSMDPIVVFSNTDGVSMYYSNDNGRTFQAYDNGRKLIDIPDPSRDPKVFWYAPTKSWVMVVWSADSAGSNGVNIYTSPNLTSWTYRSRFSAPWLFECPDMFQLPMDGNTSDERFVLTTASSQYVVGTFDGTTFSTDWTAPQKMDQGDNGAGSPFYAAQTFNDMPDGRVVQMAWQGGNQGSTWTGDATFPAELKLVSTPDGPRITRNPIAELSTLRDTPTTWSNRTITTDPSSDPFAGISADTYEINAEFDLSGATASQFGFALHKRADGTSDRTVVYDVGAQTLYGKPLAPQNGLVKVHILVDRGQLEVFGDDGLLSVSDNVNFDSSAGSQGIGLFATGGSVKLVSAQFNKLESAWGQGESTLASNLTGPWKAAGGTWTDVAGGKQGDATGDGFYLSRQSGSDFTYEGDVRADTAGAAGLTFRSSADGSQQYTANIDTSGLLKLWRPGRDIATYSTPIVKGRTYHLKVVASGSHLQVYFDNGTTPVIDATDTAYASGLFGANVFNGEGVVQNLTVQGAGFKAFDSGPWQTASGQWTVTPGGLHGTNSTDGFYLSNRTGTDFTYQADLQVVNGTAAGLTFRSSADGSQQYTANIDTSGLLKLWRPGQDIATYSTPVIEGRTYHLKVVASGSHLQVYFDNGTTPVIDATDSTYTSGLFGVNVFNGSSLVQNATVS